MFFISKKTITISKSLMFYQYLNKVNNESHFSQSLDDSDSDQSRRSVFGGDRSEKSEDGRHQRSKEEEPFPAIFFRQISTYKKHCLIVGLYTINLKSHRFRLNLKIIIDT